jgi:hypothetical protein
MHNAIHRPNLKNIFKKAINIALENQQQSPRIHIVFRFIECFQLTLTTLNFSLPIITRQRLHIPLHLQNAPFVPRYPAILQSLPASFNTHGH